MAKQKPMRSSFEGVGVVVEPCVGPVGKVVGDFGAEADGVDAAGQAGGHGVAVGACGCLWRVFEGGPVAADGCEGVADAVGVIAGAGILINPYIFWTFFAWFHSLFFTGDS